MSSQWFPGHMQKAKREIESILNSIDSVFDLVDARAPLASRNPFLGEVLHSKTNIVILHKSALADPAKTREWTNYFHQQGIRAVAVDSETKFGFTTLIQKSKEMYVEKTKASREKGINPPPARILIAGIPNVGKSTLINQLANRKIAKTADTPGVTRSQQWIKTNHGFDLLDTPGILWPKFEHQEDAYRLALLGTIKESLLPIEELSIFGISFLRENYRSFLEARYKIDVEGKSPLEILEQIGKKRGTLEKGGLINLEKAAELFLRDFRQSQFGAITLELVPPSE
jgi:ribosome biogenesis GTPase A